LAAATTLIRIPQVLACESVDDTALLLLEWIELKPLAAPSAALLGHALADLHAARGEKFGLPHNNFIGGSPQLNTPHEDWVSFWQHCRLLPQLEMAARNRFPSKLIDRGERLVADCGALFRAYQPVPSLLHGDLWGGNVGQDSAGLPVLFDPAVYYGDREADIAMTELFGGFATDFYAAYHNAWPLDVGFGVRKNFYNLYHVLNHANLFAGDYVRQSEKMIEALLAELG
jgi:protein-ribulosamine 3-kinase